MTSSLLGLFLIGLVVAAGACVQGAVGMGLGMLAAPIAALVDARMVPGPLLVASMLLSLTVAWREWSAVDLRGVRWALVGRLPGTVLGALAVAALPERALALAFAVLVLVAVAMSLHGWRLDPTAPSLLAAGVLSGLMGTAVSIGGPPMALVYQRAMGRQLRATMAAYVAVGTALSLAFLALVGEFGREEGLASLWLAPFTLAGYALSRLAVRVLDRDRTRAAVLLVSAASAVALLVRELALSAGLRG